MPQSPPDDREGDALNTYRRGWRAAQRLIFEGRSWSGRERNCVFLNTGGERFGSVSAISGLDFPDDGRGVAVVDWDHDGDQDLWFSNRTGPRLRLLINRSSTTANDSVAIRLRGTRCNRDAIGARVTLRLQETPPRTLVRTLYAGDAFLSQSSKWLHFGLGEQAAIESLEVRWPDGQRETVTGISPGGRYLVTQGSGQAVPEASRRDRVEIATSRQPTAPADPLTRVALSTPVPLPQLEYATLDGGPPTTLEPAAGPRLITIWASWCAPCIDELTSLNQERALLADAGIDLVALGVDAADPEREDELAAIAAQLEARQFDLRIAWATPATLDKLQLLLDTLFARKSSLAVPMSLLVDAEGRLANLYWGPVTPTQLVDDVAQLGLGDLERRRQAVPLTGRWYQGPIGLSLEAISNAFREPFPQDALRYLQLTVAELNAASTSAASDDGQRFAQRRLRANLSLAYLLRQLGQTQEALHHARLAAEANRTDIGARLFLAQTERDLGNHEASSDHYRLILEIDPRRTVSRMALAEQLEASGNLDEAIQELTTALENGQDQADARARLGLWLGRAGRTEEAVSQLRQALTDETSDPVAARFNLGLALERLGRHREASAEFAQLLAVRPADAEIRRRLARAYTRLGEYQQALPHWETLLQESPQNAQLHLELGLCCSQLADSARAAQSYRQALDLNPSLTLAAANLAWILATAPQAELRSGEEALQWARRAIESAPSEDPALLDVLAAAEAENGAFDAAVVTLEQGLELAAKSATSPELISLMQMRLQAYQEGQPFRDVSQ